MGLKEILKTREGMRARERFDEALSQVSPLLVDDALKELVSRAKAGPQVGQMVVFTYENQAGVVERFVLPDDFLLLFPGRTIPSSSLLDVRLVYGEGGP